MVFISMPKVKKLTLSQMDILKFLCLLFFLNSACSPIKKPVPNTNHIIFQFEEVNHLSLFENATPTNLLQSEITQIEQILEKEMSQYNQKIQDNVPHAVIKSLSDYQYQYIPVINLEGEKVVWINAFCNAWHIDWKKDILYVNDGGSCYFQMKINISTGKIFDFMVNGVA